MLKYYQLQKVNAISLNKIEPIQLWNREKEALIKYQMSKYLQQRYFYGNALK